MKGSGGVFPMFKCLTISSRKWNPKTIHPNTNAFQAAE
jgi:hypothetical protein